MTYPKGSKNPYYKEHIDWLRQKSLENGRFGG